MASTERRASHEEKVEIAKAALAEGHEIHVKINFGYNDRRSLVGLLRAAYLLMFRYFGYQYIADTSSKPVRWQINNPLETTGVLNGIKWRLPNVPKISQMRPQVVCVVQAPPEFQCFLVILRLDAQSNHHAGVALPPPGENGTDLYKRLESPGAAGLETMIPIQSMHKRAFYSFAETWRALLANSTGNP